MLALNQNIRMRFKDAIINNIPAVQIHTEDSSNLYLNTINGHITNEINRQKYVFSEIRTYV